jgi:RNA polymerase sigma-70 factor (ECF subfamily)
MLDKAELNRLYRYAYSLSAQPDDAYDLLQSALEKHLRSKPNQSLENESAYVRKIIRNQFIDQARRQQCVPFETLEDADTLALDTMPLDSLLIQNELIEAIWAMLNTAEREILFLWAVEGHTASEIAIEINAPRGTILSRIYRLRQKITTHFAEETTEGTHCA